MAYFRLDLTLSLGGGEKSLLSSLDLLLPLFATSWSETRLFLPLFSASWLKAGPLFSSASWSEECSVIPGSCA